MFRRVKSSNPKGGGEEEETWEFQIVSLDNKNWQFEATSLEERDQWVQAIEQQILNSLQVNRESPKKCGNFQAPWKKEQTKSWEKNIFVSPFFHLIVKIKWFLQRKCINFCYLVKTLKIWPSIYIHIASNSKMGLNRNFCVFA